MRKTKLLFVIDGLEFGGGERVFLQLMRGLPEKRYDIHMATSPEGDFFNLLTGMGINVLPLDLKDRINFNNIKILSEIIRKKKIDIVHSQGARADFFARMAARNLRPKVKVVNTIAMPVKGYDVSVFRKYVYRFFDSFSEQYVDWFIVVSEVLRKTLIDAHKIPPDMITRIYNGIELDEYRPDDSGKSPGNIREEYNIEGDVFLMGAVGRMVWQKGFKYLVQAIPEIVSEIPDLKLLLAGNGPLRDKLEDLSEELGVRDKIIFAGFRNDIKDVLSAVDILSVPSLLEGFPMVILEAMAMAKPIVAADIDGIAEQIIDGVNGILVPPKDPSALAKAVILVLNDKELAMSMGSAAREEAEQEFSVEKMVTETEKVYSSLMKKD